MNLYSRTFGVLKKYWVKLFIASFSAAMYAIMSGLFIWMAGPLLMTLFQSDQAVHSQAIPDSGISPESLQGLEKVEQISTEIVSLKESLKGMVNSLVEAETKEKMLYKFCWIIVIIVLVKNLFLYIQGFFMAFVQQSVILHFRNSLFEKYQRLSLDYFTKRRTGQVISRVTNDVVVLNESIDIGFNRLVTDSLMVVLFTSFLIIISWKLTLYAMIVLPLVFGFIWFIGKKLRKYSERSQERMEDVNSILEESVNNVRIVKAFSMEKFEINKFMAATRKYYNALLRMTRIRHLASPINDSLATMAGVMILYFAGIKIVGGYGELDAGDFLTFVLAMFSIIKPVKSLSQIHIKIQEGMAASERIFRVIDADEKIKDSSNPVKIESFKNKISYSNVSFHYNESEPVLKNINFDINCGEIVAVVGPSGGGKSTLIDLLPRFYDPLVGSITIDGIDIRELSLASLRGLMGIVTQETILFNDTIKNNIAYGMTDIPESKIIEAAEMANAHKFIGEFENKYDTLVGNRGVMLSGGQRQRIAIARALLKDPQILLFDEATSALDTESELLVQEAINRLMNNRTSLVIAHRLSTIKNADKILVIDKGQIVESGNHSKLVDNNLLYKKLYRMQFQS